MTRIEVAQSSLSKIMMVQNWTEEVKDRMVVGVDQLQLREGQPEELG
jgi:hypothetical protein